ncbi:lipoprotein [uncultured Castellaniella sp.]|jgi:hypothetical protein|uniref:lipoprotein n=1 Tax=uncultured Castellaniella sp. TaxID=647907 RepID=UPI00261378BA|nr:lipoprotein [uncultured Castellaniella sp.]
MTIRTRSRFLSALAGACLALLLAGCGMKGPLKPATPPPPADAALVAPPTVAPATSNP